MNIHDRHVGMAYHVIVYDAMRDNRRLNLNACKPNRLKFVVLKNAKCWGFDFELDMTDIWKVHVEILHNRRLNLNACKTNRLKFAVLKNAGMLGFRF